MKKQFNTGAIINELTGNSAFFRQKSGAKEKPKTPVDGASDASATQASRKPTDAKVKQSHGESHEQLLGTSTTESANRSSHRSTKESTARSIDRSTTESIDDSAILGKPKAFYISEKQDKDLNRAVELLTNELSGKINQKIDRSTIVRLILTRSRITRRETIIEMADQLVSQLVSRLTG